MLRLNILYEKKCKRKPRQKSIKKEIRKMVELTGRAIGLRMVE